MTGVLDFLCVAAVAIDYLVYYAKSEHYFPPERYNKGLVAINGSFSMVPTQPPLQYINLENNYWVDGEQHTHPTNTQ